MVEYSDGGNRRLTKGFFRKLRDLDDSRVKPTSTILDESGQPIQTSEERLSRWKRHFEGVLNVSNAVAEKLIVDVED